MGLVIRGIVISCLAGACHLLRTLPEPVPLDFTCQVQPASPTIYLTDRTRITLSLTPNNEETQAGSLTLTEWRLPEGLQGLLLDAEGKAIVPGTPLAWGEHLWWYIPHNAGAHRITLRISEPCEEDRLVTLAPVRVLESAPPGTFSVSAWLRALTAEEERKLSSGDKDVVALELRLEDAPPEAPFKLRQWKLPQGLKGVLQNEAGEQLNAFPLCADQKNTLFLCLDKGSNYRTAQHPLQLQVQGPGGVVRQQEADLDLVRGKALGRLMEVFRQLVLRLDDRNPADYLGREDSSQLGRGERLAREYIRAMRRVMEEAAAYGAVEDLPGEMPRHYSVLAARKEKLESVLEQLEKQAVLWSTIEQHGGFAGLVLHLSRKKTLTNNEESSFKIALRRNNVNAKFRDGRTALHYVAESGNQDAFHLLLREGANVNAKGSQGETPLILAVQQGDTSMVRELFNHGADVSVQMHGGGGSKHYKDLSGWGPLFAAIESGDRSIVHMVLQAAKKQRVGILLGCLPLLELKKGCYETYWPAEYARMLHKKEGDELYLHIAEDISDSVKWKEL